jgi:hypothetical protein
MQRRRGSRFSAEQISRIKRLRVKGHTLGQIAREVGIKSPGSVGYALSRPDARLSGGEMQRHVLNRFIRNNSSRLRLGRVGPKALLAFVEQNLARPKGHVARELGVSSGSYSNLLRGLGLAEKQRALSKGYWQSEAHFREKQNNAFWRAVTQLTEMASRKGPDGKPVGPEKLFSSFVRTQRGGHAIMRNAYYGAGASFKSVFEAAFPGYKYVPGRGKKPPAILKKTGA